MVWQRDVKGLDTAKMKFFKSAPSLKPASHTAQLQCLARSTHKAPLPGSYALAIGPHEGKEGSKAFWGEPLQRDRQRD